MATLKHINSKNADYGAAEQYLLFEHDEFTMKPVLDETGRLIPREDYRLSTLNCDGEDFAVACMRANLRYQKNQRREDVKSHHYIISFDPRDGPDNGLTVDRAQALGEQFCKEHFPGHQALVCTHSDNSSCNGVGCTYRYFQIFCQIQCKCASSFRNNSLQRSYFGNLSSHGFHNLPSA